MLLKPPNAVIYAVLLMLAGMVFMTAGRFVMNSSKTLYVVLMSSTALSIIGAAYFLSRNK